MTLAEAHALLSKQLESSYMIRFEAWNHLHDTCREITTEWSVYCIARAKYFSSGSLAEAVAAAVAAPIATDGNEQSLKDSL